ncbi:MAG: hypothetical protein QG580_200 [Patescibacteria group bacterium]|nr:hypothetical protein [Patescibacteria group bacterium]
MFLWYFINKNITQMKKIIPNKALSDAAFIGDVKSGTSQKYEVVSKPTKEYIVLFEFEFDYGNKLLWPPVETPKRDEQISIEMVKRELYHFNRNFKVFVILGQTTEVKRYQHSQKIAVCIEKNPHSKE